jgi:hypothetical protein
MKAQVKKTHLKLGTGRRGPGRWDGPRRTNQRSSGLAAAATHKQKPRRMLPSASGLLPLYQMGCNDAPNAEPLIEYPP